MKIALFTSSRTAVPPEKGIIAASSSLTALLADGLVEKGHDVTLYAPKGSVSKAHIIDLGLSPSRADYALKHEEWVKNYNLGMKLLYIGELYAHAQEYDVIHLQTEPVYLGMPFARLTQTPTLFTNHNPFLPQEKTLLMQYKDLPIVTISEYQKSVFPQLSYAATIYDGISVENYPFSATSSSDNMLFLGRLTKEKGVAEAIEAAEMTEKALTIAGSGTNDCIAKTITPHLSQHISFIGTLERESQSFFNTLSRAKLLLSPFQWEEPFGLTMIEAMACGTPVITFAKGSVPEIIEDGKTGFIVNPSNEDIRGNFLIKKTGLAGLTEAIKKLYALDEKSYRQMRQQCRQRVETLFSVEKMINEYEKIYNKLVQSR